LYIVSMSAHLHSMRRPESEIDASVPTVIDSWTVVRWTTTIVRWRRNEHDVILRQGQATGTASKYVMEYIHTYTYIYIHIHQFNYIYIDIHANTCIYIHIHVYTYIYICCAIYHSSLRPRERDSVYCLHTQPILVANVDGREELEGRFNVRNGFQPVKDRVEFFSAEMAVLAVGKGEAERSDPIWVIIQDKMHQLVRQILQHGRQADKVGLRQTAGGCPGQVHHEEPKISRPSHAQGAQ
jgi:hypothetical protein